VQVFEPQPAYIIERFTTGSRVLPRLDSVHACARCQTIEISRCGPRTNSKLDVPLVFVAKLGYLQKCIDTEPFQAVYFQATRPVF
jgi:hypothetical protein